MPHRRRNYNFNYHLLVGPIAPILIVITSFYRDLVLMGNWKLNSLAFFIAVDGFAFSGF